MKSLKVVVIAALVLMSAIVVTAIEGRWDGNNATGIDNVWTQLGFRFLTNQTPICSGFAYCIYNQSGTVIAVNGTTQNVDFSGGSFETVSESAFASLYSTRTWYESVKYFGNFVVDDTADLLNWTEIDARGAYFKLADGTGNINVFSKSDDYTNHIKIIGGTYDGNKANRATWSVLLLGSSANGSDWLIDGATFRDSTGDAVFFVGPYKSIINSVFSGIDDTAIVFSGSLGARASNHTSALNNKIYDSNVGFAIANDGGNIEVGGIDIINSTQAAIGIEITSGLNVPSEINIHDFYIENVGANSAAILVENATGLSMKLKDGDIKGTMRRGIAITGGDYFQISGITFSGANYRECIRAVLNNSIIVNNVCINASTEADNTYSGFYIENSSWNLVESNIFINDTTNNPNYDIREVSNSNYNTFLSNNVSGQGKILLVGFNSIQRNNMGISPFDYGVKDVAPSFNLGFGDSYSNSTSGEPFCKYGTSWQNATGDTTVC